MNAAEKQNRSDVGRCLLANNTLNPIPQQKNILASTNFGPMPMMRLQQPPPTGGADRQNTAVS